MKKYILCALSALLIGLTSCNDFLDVNSNSSEGEEYVFGNYDEINRVLTSVYAALLNGNSYAGGYYTNFALNSDVEFTANTGSIRGTAGNDFRVFDGTRHGNQANQLWNALYSGVEKANLFIHGLQRADIFSTEDELLMHQLGEAKVLRAMMYHDLVVHFGDIPFTELPSYELSSLIIPITDRNQVLTFLIEDLIDIAPHMYYAHEQRDGVERASREFCYGLIARMALTRGGYSLYPNTSNPLDIGTMQRPEDYRDYYEIARTYAGLVIDSDTHELKKSFRQVFIDECNYVVTNDDDPIFEIPFLVNHSGNVGYHHGPAVATSNDVTPHVWGASSGTGVRLSALYRYSFDRQDLRLGYTIGMWHYDSSGEPALRNDYYVHCNKWSKLWMTRGNAMGSTSTGSTGINYPYMRYAEILLMYAEAVNELENGVSGQNGAKAIEAFRQVRQRAFAPEDWAEKVDAYIASVSGSKDSFFQALANERKWEFGGENMRWKDLVRWNLYAQVVYESFMDYFVVGNAAGGNYLEGWEKYEGIPFWMFFKKISNPGDTDIYPNTELQILELYNEFDEVLSPGNDWDQVQFHNWYDEGNEDGLPRAACLYSFRGYIRAGVDSNYRQLDPNNLPPVRYILPIPNTAVQQSNETYKNYYGYN